MIINAVLHYIVPPKFVRRNFNINKPNSHYVLVHFGAILWTPAKVQLLQNILCNSRT